MLFYSTELLHVHITCLHVYYCLHIPSSLAQDARLCHGRGKDHRKLWRNPNSSSSLGFHGFGVVHAKGSLEVAEVALPGNPSLPHPAEPRDGSSTQVTSRTVGSTYCSQMSCAILSPVVREYATPVWLNKTTPMSPRQSASTNPPPTDSPCFNASRNLGATRLYVPGGATAERPVLMTTDSIRQQCDLQQL